MAHTEIREVNGQKVGFNLDTNSYYQIGDNRYDPNYIENPATNRPEEPGEDAGEQKRRVGRPRGEGTL